MTETLPGGRSSAKGGQNCPIFAQLIRKLRTYREEGADPASAGRNVQTLLTYLALGECTRRCRGGSIDSADTKCLKLSAGFPWDAPAFARQGRRDIQAL